MAPNIFIAAAMRSGSTHVTNCFQMLGLRRATVHIRIEDCWNEDEMVDLKSAQILLPMGGWVLQHHMRAIGRNAYVLGLYDIKPIVLYRNLFDSIVSWSESHRVNILEGRGATYTFSHIHSINWDGMSQREREGWLLYQVVPWYYSFLVSWAEADIETLFMSYEEFFKDQVSAIEKMIDFVGFHKIPVASIVRATEVAVGKPNVCRSGRGREQLSQSFVDAAYDQADCWGPKWGPFLRERLLDAP